MICSGLRRRSVFARRPSPSPDPGGGPLLCLAPSSFPAMDLAGRGALGPGPLCAPQSNGSHPAAANARVWGIPAGGEPRSESGRSGARRWGHRQTPLNPQGPGGPGLRERKAFRRRDSGKRLQGRASAERSAGPSLPPPGHSFSLPAIQRSTTYLGSWLLLESGTLGRGPTACSRAPPAPSRTRFCSPGQRAGAILPVGASRNGQGGAWGPGGSAGRSVGLGPLRGNAGQFPSAGARAECPPPWGRGRGGRGRGLGLRNLQAYLPSCPLASPPHPVRSASGPP